MEEPVCTYYFFRLHHLKRVPGLLHCPLIALRRLAIRNIPLQPLPPLAQRPQLPLQDERNRKVHLKIRHRELVAEQKLPAALAQLRRHEVQIRLDVLRQSDLGVFGVAGLLVPASVHDRDAVEREGAFGGVHPLQDGVALWVAEGWEQAVGGVVGVAEVSSRGETVQRIALTEREIERETVGGETYSAIFPLSVMVTPLSTMVGNFPSPPTSFLNSGGARPFWRGENLSS